MSLFVKYLQPRLNCTFHYHSFVYCSQSYYFLQEDAVYRNDARSPLNSESHRLDSSREEVVLKALNSRLISTSDHTTIYFLSITDPNLTRHFFCTLRIISSATTYHIFYRFSSSVQKYVKLSPCDITFMYVYVHCSKTDTRSFERKFNVLINYLAVIIRNLNYPKDQFLQATFMILLPTSKSPFLHCANVLSNMKNIHL